MNYLRIITLYIIVVLILNLIPTSGGDGIALSSRNIFFIRADYLLHLLLFIPLMVLVWLYMNKENITGVTRFNHALLWLLAGIIFAALLEVIHLFLPHRSFNPVDLILNVSGVILGALIFLWDPKLYAKLE